MPRIKNIEVNAQHPENTSSCNVCCAGKNITEIKLGCNNQTIAVRICDECIQVLGEKLWQRMEELENGK